MAGNSRFLESGFQPGLGAQTWKDARHLRFLTKALYFSVWTHTNILSITNEKNDSGWDFILHSYLTCLLIMLHLTFTLFKAFVRNILCYCWHTIKICVFFCIRQYCHRTVLECRKWNVFLTVTFFYIILSS